MFKFLKYALTVTTIFILATVSWAQEAELESISGEVVEIDVFLHKISVECYDEEDELEIVDVFIVDSKTEFEGVSSVKEISKGMLLDVDYVVEDDGKKVAQYISVYELESEDDESELEY